MTAKKIQIYPVIEMSPWRISGGDDLKIKDGQDYSDFALEVFRNHGINSITRLDEHAYSSIKISDINDSDLKILIKKELEDAEISENGTEIVGAFCGGLVIIINESNIINHQCCGSISDYKNWAKFIDKSPSDWEEIWIGHPWIYARIQNNIIEFSNYTEHTGKLDPETLKIKAQIDLSTFKEQLDLAIFELKEFKKRILFVLEEEMSDLANQLTELLVENESH